MIYISGQNSIIMYSLRSDYYPVKDTTPLISEPIFLTTGGECVSKATFSLRKTALVLEKNLLLSQPQGGCQGVTSRVTC